MADLSCMYGRYSVWILAFAGQFSYLYSSNCLREWDKILTKLLRVHGRVLVTKKAVLSDLLCANNFEESCSGPMHSLISRLTRIEAARKIERYWCSYRDKQMFKLLKYAICAAVSLYKSSLKYDLCACALWKNSLPFVASVEFMMFLFSGTFSYVWGA